VWASSTTTLNPHFINPHLDGVQHILPDIFTTNPTEVSLTKTLFLLWYIWKARNDKRFQRKSWTSFQVHNAAATHFQTNLSAWEEHNQPVVNQGPSSDPHHHPNVEDPYMSQFPSELQGFRCYTDASISPDHPMVGARRAGLGIFIVNTDLSPPISVFIKASMQKVSSVLMVESAGLALASSIISRMHIGETHLLVDNRLLVNYINGLDHSNPPDWTVIPFTQTVNNLLPGTTMTVHKIRREHNQMADSLARQSISSLQDNQLDFSGSCVNPSHANGCPFLEALQLVTINDVMILTTSCC
jgi:hypothetical protein